METVKLEGKYFWSVGFSHIDDDGAIDKYGNEEWSNISDPNVWLADQIIKGVDYDISYYDDDMELMESTFSKIEFLSKIDTQKQTETSYSVEDLDIEVVKKLVQEFLNS